MISPENQPSKFSLIPVSCSRRPGYEATTINSCLYSIVSRDVRAEYQIAKSSQAVVHRDDNRTSGVSNVLTIIKFASRIALHQTVIHCSLYTTVSQAGRISLLTRMKFPP